MICRPHFIRTHQAKRHFSSPQLLATKLFIASIIRQRHFFVVVFVVGDAESYFSVLRQLLLVLFIFLLTLNSLVFPFCIYQWFSGLIA